MCDLKSNLKALLFVFCFSYSFGQNEFFPLEFEDQVPLWTYISCDSSLIDQPVLYLPFLNYDGYGQVFSPYDPEKELPIADGYAYLVTPTWDYSDYDGALIEKINLETGELIWQSVFDHRTAEYRESVYRSVIENGELLICSIEIHADHIGTPAIIFGSRLGYLKKRYYDLETGELLRETFPDTTASDIAAIRPKVYGGGGAISILSDDRVEVITVGNKFEIGYFLLIDTLDEAGLRLTETDTFAQNLNLDWADTGAQFDDKFVRDDEDNLYFLNLYNPISQPDDFSSAQLLVRDKNKNVKELAFDFDDFENVTALRIANITETHLIVQVVYEDISVQILYVNKDTGKVDRTVNHEERWTNASMECLTMYYDEFIFVRFNVRDDDKYEMEFKLSEGEEVVTLSTFVMTEPDWRLAPDDLQRLDKGDFLLTLKYSEQNPTNDPGRQYSAFVRLSPEQVGLTTSVVEIDNSENLLKLYPNPVSERLTIEFESDLYYDLHIYDMVGNLVMKKNDCNWVEKMDLSDMVAGSYAVTLRTAEKLYSKLFHKI